jgi:tight adherence protein B
MSQPSSLAAGCLLAAAITVALPGRGGNARRRLAALARGNNPRARPGQAPRRPGWRPPLWTSVVACAGTAVIVATMAGGPVAGGAVAAYCGVAVRLLRRRRADRSAARSRTRVLDALYSLAAELRAGAPATTVSVLEGGDRLAGLVEALRRTADQTGAPLADLLERVAADARATDRISTVAAAQAAGAQATAWLLAALPAGGIALGYTIGADPVHVLLHTPIGAACTAGAIVLQVAGLAWADRLIRPSPFDAQTGRLDPQAGRLGWSRRWLGRPPAGFRSRVGRLGGPAGRFSAPVGQPGTRGLR